MNDTKNMYKHNHTYVSQMEKLLHTHHQSVVLYLKYGCPRFLKVYVMTLCFYERPMLILVFTNQKKYKDFCLYEKKAKS